MWRGFSVFIFLPPPAGLSIITNNKSEPWFLLSESPGVVWCLWIMKVFIMNDSVILFLIALSRCHWLRRWSYEESSKIIQTSFLIPGSESRSEYLLWALTLWPPQTPVRSKVALHRPQIRFCHFQSSWMWTCDPVCRVWLTGWRCAPFVTCVELFGPAAPWWLWFGCCRRFAVFLAGCSWSELHREPLMIYSLLILYKEET